MENTLTLETGKVSNKDLSWYFYIFTDEQDPNFRVELVIYSDGIASINNIEVSLSEFHRVISKLLKRI